MLEYILECNHLEIADLVRCSLTCKHLYKIITNNNKLWRHKFFQRWPSLKGHEEFNESRGEIKNWKDAVQASICSRRKLLHQISLMSNENYRKQELSDYELKKFDKLFCPEKGSHPMAYYFLVDELMNLIGQPEITSNLTDRYYALKVLGYMKESHIKLDWQRFISLPAKEQILEKGASIVAQWIQPEKNISYSHIVERLDNIAEQAKQVLREENPSHPIFSTPEECFAVWKNNVLEDNQWSVPETRQAIDAVSKVLFDILGFCAIRAMYDNSEHIVIDHVLEHHEGNPITLFIIYESVARRLGICCVFVSLPSHFVLEWTARETTFTGEYTEKYYIDIFNHGRLLTKDKCPEVSKCPLQEYKIFEGATAAEVVKSMVAILEKSIIQHPRFNGRSTRLRSTLKLQLLVDPHDINAIFELARFYMTHDMNLTDILRILSNMRKNADVTSRAQIDFLSRTAQELKKCPEQVAVPKQRSPYIKYAVGLVIWNFKEGYFCVITDWGSSYNTLLEWNEHVNDNIMDLRDPLYYVLRDNGSSNLVKEDEVVLPPYTRCINHYEIGRHFRMFNGTYYVPNEEKARRYPFDEAVRETILNNVYTVDSVN